MAFDGSELKGRSVALYGRFSTAPRAAYVAAVEAAGGRIARDLTRGTDVLVVGLGARALAASGALDGRLAAARARDIPIYGEERLRDLIRGERVNAGLPLAAALKDAALAPAELGMLAAFDVVRLDGAGAEERCRFEDAGPLRQAAALIADGFSAFEAARTLRAARAAPPGRRKVVALGEETALDWDDGSEFTALDGQRFLPLDLTETAEDRFDEAMEAEEDGDFAEAERLYALCAAADRRDPIAPYNLAAAYEASAEPAKAEEALEQALRIDPQYDDALFNLAQLRLKRGAYADAKLLFDAYLALDPPSEWAGKARKALTLIAAAGGGA